MNNITVIIPMRSELKTVCEEQKLDACLCFLGYVKVVVNYMFL